jgi:pyruvate-formate lyase-activating enzyme
MYNENMDLPISTEGTGDLFSTVYSDEQGSIFETPDLAALGRSWHEMWEIRPGDMIPMPEGSTIMVLPGRLSLGLARGPGEALSVWTYHEVAGEGIERPGLAVAALLPIGFTRTLVPAYVVEERERPVTLPLYGYTAMAVGNGKLYVAARQTDDPSRWDPKVYNTPDLPELIRERLGESPNNRLLHQLANCSVTYSCPTAQNVFYRRWEGGIPVSPACSGNCIGCISLQPSECCPSPQARIDFVPSVEEIVEIAVPHLEEASNAVISFGQGCEGDPLLQSETLSHAITCIRAETYGGTLNLNTNAGLTREMSKVLRAGLDSVRVSLISARKETYDAYHRPQGYSLGNVMDSIKEAKGFGAYVSLNLLSFPGLTDRKEEFDALSDFIGELGIDMIQLRNLNIDPDILVQALPGPSGEIIGMDKVIDGLRVRFPHVRLGSFSPSREELGRRS